MAQLVDHAKPTALAQDIAQSNRVESAWPIITKTLNFILIEAFLKPAQRHVRHFRRLFL
jgi:hypothetical protein